MSKEIKAARARITKAQLQERIAELEDEVESQKRMNNLKSEQLDDAVAEIDALKQDLERKQSLVDSLHATIRSYEHRMEDIERVEREGRERFEMMLKSDAENRELKAKIQAHEDLTHKVEEFERTRQENSAIHGSASRELFQTRKHMARVKLRLAEAAHDLTASSNPEAQKAGRALLAIASGADPVKALPEEGSKPNV